MTSLMDLYQSASGDTLVAGRTWYSTARCEIQTVADRYGVDLQTACAVTAALSPMLRWSQNVIGLERVLQAHSDGMPTPPSNATLFRKNALKAWAVLKGETKLTEESPKVYSFWQNLLGSNEHVTVDTWMLRALDHPRAGKGVTNKEYQRLAQTIRDAANSVGEDAPSFQAICWLRIRETWSR